MADMPPLILERDFEAVDTADEKEVLRQCSGTMKSLHWWDHAQEAYSLTRRLVDQFRSLIHWRVHPG